MREGLDPLSDKRFQPRWAVAQVFGGQVILLQGFDQEIAAHWELARYTARYSGNL